MSREIRNENVAAVQAITLVKIVGRNKIGEKKEGGREVVALEKDRNIVRIQKRE